MIFQLSRFLVLLLGLTVLLQNTASAEAGINCPISPSILIHSCKTDTSVYLKVLPDEALKDSEHLLTVAGTYSSADRFGIEGLVIQDGKTVSRRYQNWDGVLVLNKGGVPNLYHATAVKIDGRSFDLKKQTSRANFITTAKQAGVSVLQSHLLISNSILDLKDVEDAPKFKRRLLVTFEDGSFAVWETRKAETLYAAAHQVQEELNPKMALNLDMGAYDYCRAGPRDAETDCGRLIGSADKLTNLLEFRAR